MTSHLTSHKMGEGNATPSDGAQLGELKPAQPSHPPASDIFRTGLNYRKKPNVVFSPRHYGPLTSELHQHFLKSRPLYPVLFAVTYSLPISSKEVSPSWGT